MVLLTPWINCVSFGGEAHWHGAPHGIGTEAASDQH